MNSSASSPFIWDTFPGTDIFNRRAFCQLGQDNKRGNRSRSLALIIASYDIKVVKGKSLKMNWTRPWNVSTLEIDHPLTQIGYPTFRTMTWTPRTAANCLVNFTKD